MTIEDFDDEASGGSRRHSGAGSDGDAGDNDDPLAALVASAQQKVTRNLISSVSRSSLMDASRATGSPPSLQSL